VLGVEPRWDALFREEEDQVPSRAVVVLGPELLEARIRERPSCPRHTSSLDGAQFHRYWRAPEDLPGASNMRHPTSTCPWPGACVFDHRQKIFFEDRDDRECGRQARLNRSTTLEEAQNELAVFLAKNFETDI